MTQAAIVPGSLGAVAKKTGQSIAQGFLNVKCLVMVDTSGSMNDADAGDGLTRHEAARLQLERLQAENPGEVGVCSFSSSAEFCPGGVPNIRNSSTDMVAALKMMKMADGCGIRLVLISDGCPDEAAVTLALARTFTSRIDTIYVGNEGDYGRKFLQQLSDATGGISITNAAAELSKLSDNITKLIGAGA